MTSSFITALSNFHSPMIRSALLTGPPRHFRCKRSSASCSSGLRPGPNNEQAAVAIQRNVPREGQSSVHPQCMGKTPSPVALSCAQGCVLTKGSSTAMNTSENFHLEPLAVADYDALLEAGRLDRRPVELLNGLLIAKAPQSPEHATIEARLVELLVNACGKDAFVKPASPIVLKSNTSRPEPDLAIVSRDVHRRRHHPSPSDIFFVVEISHSTIRYDSNEKLKTYAMEGIPEYWIVDVNKRSVRVLRSPEGEHYSYGQVVTKGIIVPAALPNCIVSVDEVFS